MIKMVLEFMTSKLKVGKSNRVCVISLKFGWGQFQCSKRLISLQKLNSPVLVMQHDTRSLLKMSDYFNSWLAFINHQMMSVIAFWLALHYHLLVMHLLRFVIRLLIARQCYSDLSLLLPHLSLLPQGADNLIKAKRTQKGKLCESIAKRQATQRINVGNSMENHLTGNHVKVNLVAIKLLLILLRTNLVLLQTNLVPYPPLIRTSYISFWRCFIPYNPTNHLLYIIMLLLPSK